MTEREMRPPVERWLLANGYTVRHERQVCGGYADLIGVRWHPRVGRLIPEIAEVIVVELKVRDVGGVLRQLAGAMCVAHRVWAAMPEPIVRSMRAGTLRRFREKGYGLLGVRENWVQIYVEACKREERVIPDYIRRRMWRGPSWRELARRKL